MVKTQPGKAILCVSLLVLFLCIQGCSNSNDETSTGYRSLYVTSDAGGQKISNGRYTSYSSLGECVAGGRSSCAGYSAFHGVSAGLAEPTITNETAGHDLVSATEKTARVDKPE